MRPIKFVSATQVPQSLFWSATYLGRSLRRIPENLRPPLHVICGNTGPGALGLSQIFNQVLDATDPGTDLVFLHDDVYLNDWFVAPHVAMALSNFDVVGLAGSANPDLSQPSWGLHFNAELEPQGWQPGLRRSGAVNHFEYTSPDVMLYGPAPMACTLLDGLFLAVKTSVIKERGVRFDTRFKFHCYDIDFCRSAAQKQLRLGTWPIAVTHDSGGNFGSAAFKEAARLYLDKWRVGESQVAARSGATDAETRAEPAASMA
jgi:GT2 family glycosyltransferase